MHMYFTSWIQSNPQILGTFPSPPQITQNLYVFNTTSGYLSVQDDTLQIPNGVAFSPDYSILYVTDTGALNAAMGLPLDSQGHRTVPPPPNNFNVRSTHMMFLHPVLFATVVPFTTPTNGFQMVLKLSNLAIFIRLLEISLMLLIPRVFCWEKFVRLLLLRIWCLLGRVVFGWLDRGLLIVSRLRRMSRVGKSWELF